MENEAQRELSQQRVAKLQALLEENILIDQNVEEKTFNESLLKVERIMKASDDIAKTYNKHENYCRELLLHTELLKRSVDVVHKTIQLDTGFSDKTFTAKLSNWAFQEGKADWSDVCSYAATVGHRLLTNANMLHFIDTQPKAKEAKQRASRKSKTLAEEKRPTQSDKLDRKEDGSAMVAQRLLQIKQIYRDGNRAPIPYFKLIIDPNDFMNTVNNALQLSLLVKENLIIIENGSDGYPSVRPMTKGDSISDEPHQSICRIDMNICRNFTRFYNITEPLLS